jgi:hypothetical protein
MRQAASCGECAQSGCEKRRKRCNALRKCVRRKGGEERRARSAPRKGGDRSFRVGFVSRKEMPRMYEEASGTKGPKVRFIIVWYSKTGGRITCENLNCGQLREIITKFG